MQNDELNMSVSPICQKNGKRYAYVSFSDATRSAEGRIPECTITKNDGFTEEEIRQLKDYMKRELPTLKRMAAEINVLGAFLGKKTT